jgi:hypothetical protein
LLITGVKPVDELLNPVEKHWSIEFYGDSYVLNYLFHRAVSIRSRYGRVYVVISLEFGGIRTDLIEAFCRIFDCRLSAVSVSRVFRVRELIQVLKSLSDESDATVILLYPYNFLRDDPSTYYEATEISGLINRVSAGNSVLLFNTKTKFGERMPEGGSMHHHVVKVIIRLDRLGRLIKVELVKHPAKPTGLRRLFKVDLLKNAVAPAETVSLLNWVKVG